jgi:subtilase family serine protease
MRRDMEEVKRGDEEEVKRGDEAEVKRGEVKSGDEEEVKRGDEAEVRRKLQSGGFVTVSTLNQVYGISSNIGSSSLRQAVFETNSEGFSQSDLKTFQQNHGLSVQAAVLQGVAADTDCSNTANSCGEGNLDIQYIMGVAQATVGVYWYVAPAGNPFVSFLQQVQASSSPPSTLSISWGGDEIGTQTLSSATYSTFDTEALKTTAMGISIFVSSGDNGVSGNSCGCNTDSSSSKTTWAGSGTWTGTGYIPDYPASSQYVVVVGATQGPQQSSTQPEIACQV